MHRTFSARPPKIDFKTRHLKPVENESEVPRTDKASHSEQGRSFEELDKLSPEQLQQVDVTNTIEKLIEGSQFEKKLDKFFDAKLASGVSEE